MSLISVFVSGFVLRRDSNAFKTSPVHVTSSFEKRTTEKMNAIVMLTNNIERRYELSEQATEMRTNEKFERSEQEVIATERRTNKKLEAIVLSSNNEFKAVEGRYERSEDRVSQAIVDLTTSQQALAQAIADQTTAIVKQLDKQLVEVKEEVKEEVAKLNTKLDILKRNTLIGFAIVATMLGAVLLKVELSKVYTFIVGLFLKLQGV
jgi:NADH dehydrogenase/NADH:ubiquinone oxidoreductase subunit G